SRRRCAPDSASSACTSAAKTIARSASTRPPVIARSRFRAWRTSACTGRSRPLSPRDGSPRDNKPGPVMTAAHPAHERSWLEIDLDAVTENVRRFRRLARRDVRLIAVVKADGYGHGAVPVARAALAGGAAFLAASNVNEALELRAAGIAHPV